ncbi:hypothetical protein Tco_1254130 [Tanacetum coccineum]
MLKDLIDNGPYQFKPEITVKDTDGVTKIRHPQRLKDLAGEDRLRYDNDIKAVNILLFGLPVDIYTIINHYQTAKEIWDRVKELMKGTEMTKKEQQSMLYDELKAQGYTGNVGNNQASRARCTAKKRVKDSEWCKDKMLLTQAQEPGVVLNDEQHDFLSNTNAIFMANLSPVGSLNDDTVEPCYDSDIHSEVPHYDTYYDFDMLNSNIQELGYIENIVSNNESYDELKSNNDVISYTDYMLTIGNDEDNYVPPPVQKNDMMLSIIEQMKSQVE